MPKLTRVFYAFPSEPKVLGETVQNAIDMLGKEPEIRRGGIRFSPWTDMNISGQNMVSAILNNIDRADVFACDLTYPNYNVSFELGYAIGRFKRVWISLDSSIDGAEWKYKRNYYGLLGSGYAPYNNSVDLMQAFLADRPTQDLHQTLLGDIYKQPIARQEDPVLFYVKPPINTEAVNSTTEEISRSRFSSGAILDDPIENPSPSLEWYSEKLQMADAVLCHLLGNNQTGALDHNAKCALIAGLSRGFNKSMLMVVQNPFESPVDYRPLLEVHDTAAECKASVRKWMDRTSESMPRRRRRRRETQIPGRDRLDLRNLAIGEPVAENERQKLDSYFVETGTYFRAMDDPVTIVVGRRGVGKSAQLYAMEAALTGDRRNHVCVVKPVGYEIDGLVRVLRSIISKSERGYLIESLWKFLIYSEMAQSIYQMVQSRPDYYVPSDAETSLIEYYDAHASLLAPPFSERLDSSLRDLLDVGEIHDAIEQRQRISEQLHLRFLRGLREILGQVLSGYEKVSLLIDNLDAQWGTNAHIESLSELLWGLLQVLDDIVEEFRIEDYWRTAANVHITVFLRSDIFAFIQPTAPEQDKLPIQRIIWDDPEVLKRLVDQRLEFGGSNETAPGEIWKQLFPSQIVGIPTWEFVLNTVLPRPRDIIYLMREAIDGAINRGHRTVIEQDFLDAREKYSEYAFRSIQAEDDPRKGRLESIMYEFAGCPMYITRSQIEARFAAANANPGDYDFYIDLLCDLNFLAIYSNTGYAYAKHEADRQVKRRIAAQVAKNNGLEESYLVSSPFWQVLQVERWSEQLGQPAGTS